MRRRRPRFRAVNIIAKAAARRPGPPQNLDEKIRRNETQFPHTEPVEVGEIGAVKFPRTLFPWARMGMK